VNTKTSARDISYIALFATLISISGYISIPLPISTVPVTAQTLAVMLAGSLLPAEKAASCIAVFILMGAVGLPVFSGGTSGIGIIAGKTGGYLIGFLFGAAAISLIKGKKPSFFRLFAANIIGGIIVVYIFGAAWLNFVTKIGIHNTIAFGVLPFIPGDLVKAAISSLLAVRLQKHIYWD